MANMILVDYDTALSNSKTKDRVIDAVMADPTLLITVLNANHTMGIEESQNNLREAQFPFDTVLVNPLPPRVPSLTYKTMFASKLQESGEHTPTLILDDNLEAAQMWADSVWGR